MTSPKRVGRIEFGLFSPKEIRKMSVRKIIWADTYDDDGFPYPQGLMDLHLGVIDPGLRCKTCDQKAADCPATSGISSSQSLSSMLGIPADPETPAGDLQVLFPAADDDRRGREDRRA